MEKIVSQLNVVEKVPSLKEVISNITQIVIPVGVRNLSKVFNPKWDKTNKQTKKTKKGRFNEFKNKMNSRVYFMETNRIHKNYFVPPIEYTAVNKFLLER